MNLRKFAVPILIAVLALGLVACGDDDDSDGPSDGPEATEVIDGDDNGDDADTGDDTTNGDAAAEGTGTVTIDGEAYPFTVESCGSGSLVRIAGPGTTPDGEPFWIEVRGAGSSAPLATQVGVGVAEQPGAADPRGDPHWANSLDDAEQYISLDGDVMSISYTAPFSQSGQPDEPPVDGALDVTCRDPNAG